MPRPGPCFLRRPLWGPTFTNRFHSRSDDFRRILSTKDMPDRGYALSFAMRRTLAMKKGQQFIFPGGNYFAKAGPQVVPRKNRGPGTGNWPGRAEMGRRKTVKTGPRKCGAPDGERGGVGRGFFEGPWKIRGPACPGVNTRCDSARALGM